MRKFWSFLALLTIAASLAACGGSNNAAFVTPTTGTGTGTAATVAKLSVGSSAGTLAPDGTTATITVTATDANNVAVAGAVVNFATSAGTLAVTSGTTSATGQATATLSASGVAAGTAIVVTASTGSVSGKATVTVSATQRTLTLTTSVPQIPSAPGSAPATIKALVVDGSSNVVSGAPVTFTATSGSIAVTQGTTDANGIATATLGAGTSPQNRTITVTASSGASTASIQVSVIGTTLTVNGPPSLVQGAVGQYSITLADSSGNGIAGQPVTLTSANNNVLSAATVTTGSTGTATFSMTATNSGNDTITAGAEGASGTDAVAVSSQNFSLTAPATGTTVQVNIASPITFNWTASGGAGQTGTVFFSSSRGTVTPASVAVTNGAAAGAVSISSATAGPATISASAVQGGVTVATAQVNANFIATVPNTVSVQASPSAVPVSGQSTVIASVIDVAGNPVTGATVNFNIIDSTGGTLSATAGVTNSQGQASVTYTATAKSSTSNGVVITASVQGTALTSQTTLTVGGQTIFLSLGTGNKASEFSVTQDELPYTVQAVDSQGNSVNGVTITFAVQSVAYSMGIWKYQNSVWGQVPAGQNCKPTQVEEYNGVINPTPPPTGVTPVLTNIPGSVASTDVGSATTVKGTAAVNLIYPKDHATWVQVALTATATVAGTQNSTTANFILPGLSSDYGGDLTSPPPGSISPYGTNASCY